MEVSKLQRRKKKASDDNNQQLIAELCNKLGHQLISELRYNDALEEFRQAAAIYQMQQNMTMDYGRANRMIGEVYLLMERYKEALKFEEIYLTTAKQQNDLVEIQRAYCQIGRCWLLFAEDKSVGSSDDAHADFKSAEKAFLKSLIMCKDLTKLVSKWELADMQARLYLNLGVTKEHFNEVEDAIENYDTAIKICRSNDLFDLHHKCLLASGFIHSHRKNDSNMSLKIFNSALEVAKRIQDKNEKMCEALLAKSSVLLKNGDCQSAKQVLKKAYKLQTPNVIDREMIQKKLKIVLTLCQCEDNLVTTNSFDYVNRKKYYEKLGDGLCKLKNFPKAIDFYLKTLEAAQLNGESENQLIPIYVSLYQTYKDNKDYNKAIEFMMKEYELIKSEPREAAVTLLGVGSLMDLAGKDFWEAETMFRKALDYARKTEEATLEKDVLRKFVEFCRKRKMVSVSEMLEQEATGKGIDLTTPLEDTEYSEDILELSNDFDLELQLSSDPESSDSEQNRLANAKKVSQKRRPAMSVKKNAKGETKLHEACINGNYQLAKVLIDQGHALNVRDNAGWLPLHEAAIHGFRDVVELLLDSGAQSAINDKGGTSCEGITPLYDAASNGNLSVVQLLLDRGAKSTVKTDFNETPLDAVLRWFDDYGSKLSLTEREFYEEIKQRLKDECEKVGIDTTAKKFNSASSGYNSAKSRNSLSQSRQNLRFATVLSDESENEENSPEVDDLVVKKIVRLEYKNAMSRFKNPNQEHRFGDDAGEAKRRSAHLTVQEVDPDEWLENDLGPSRKKPKIHSGNSPKARSPLKHPTPSKSFSRKPSSNLFDSDSDVEINNVGENAFDVVMNAGNLSKFKPKRRNSTKSQFKAPSQTSLMDSGFSRFMETESTSTTSAVINTSSLNESFSRHPAEAHLLIKVQVGDEKIVVPTTKEAARELKIDWLIEEASRRYYCIKGIRPELKLKTADGSTLLLSDSIEVLLSLTGDSCIISEIVDWKLPSLSKRYIEACSELKCSVDHDINEQLEINRSTVHLDLSKNNLNSTTVRPIMKALQHQNTLLRLNLSNNFIENDGLKFLAQTLVTLKDLELLDVSGNMLTENGLEFFCKVLGKNQAPSMIKQVKLSFNPIQSNSLKFVSVLCRSKSVVGLSLVSCDLVDTENLNRLETIKNLDVSYNHLTSAGFSNLLRKLNTEFVETLNFERCSTANDIGDSLVKCLSSGSFACLKDLNLAGLNFNENEILDVLRSLEKCEKIKCLNLSHHHSLTFLSLKYILISMDSQSLERVKLLGCKSLRNPANSFNLQNIDGHRQSSIRVVEMSQPKAANDPAKLKMFIEKMKEIWEVVSGGRGRVEQEKNILKLLRENNGKENQFHF